MADLKASDYDVAIVGASIAGCTAALLLARAGARVSVLERSPDLDAHKRACTHLIHGSAVPTIERLGLLTRVVAAGGRLTGVDIWTRWGVIRPRSGDGHELSPELSVRRELLDPLLRRAVAAASGVELILGHSAAGLLRDRDGAVCGVVAQARDGSSKRVRARLVVGADGRGSRVAELARARAGRSQRALLLLRVLSRRRARIQVQLPDLVPRPRRRLRVPQRRRPHPARRLSGKA